MALSVAKGTFACNTGTGDQDVDVGFLPKAVIVWGTNQTATGYAAGSYYFNGLSDGTTHCCLSAGSDDAQTTAQAGSAWSESAVIQHISDATTPTIDSVATVSFTGTVLRFNWSNAPGSAWIVHYLALGGSDLSTKALLFGAKTGSTGSQPRTGVGFEPKALISNISAVTSPGSGGFIIHTLGIATAAAQMTMGLFESDGVDPTKTGSIWTEGDFYRLSDEFTDPYGRATLTSLDSDGWTESWLTVGSAWRYGVLSLGGNALFQSGVETQATSPGTKDTTTTGITPSGLFAISANVTATGRSVVLCKQSIGASDGTNEGSIWTESVDNLGDSNTNSATLTDKALRFATSDTTTDAEADASFSADKFTLDWTTADGNARKFAYLALGLAPAGQTLYPDADIDTGDWATTPLWSKVEEETADGTVISATSS